MPHPLIIFELRRKWSALRRFRLPASLMQDYRILRNYAARLLKEEKK